MLRVLSEVRGAPSLRTPESLGDVARVSMQQIPPALPPSALAVLRVEAARADLAGLGLAPDDAAEQRFARYLALLLNWNARAGLTTVTAPDDIARRHFGESMALLGVLRRAGLLPQGARLVDVGSGAGFPGLPMAIVDPSLRVTLLESHTRKAEFLRAAVESMGLVQVEVVHARAEDAARDLALREAFDGVVARAVAPLGVLVELTLPFVRLGGSLATPKGERALVELVDAASAIEALGGRAEEPLALPLGEGAPGQLVLVVRRVRALDARYPRRAGMPGKRPLGGVPGAR